jgi:hypothetical protein
MTETPNFIGGPKCGLEVEPVPIGHLGPEITVATGGCYQRLSVVPNWMGDAPFKVAQPIYLWHTTYHDANPKPPAPKEGA